MDTERPPSTMELIDALQSYRHHPYPDTVIAQALLLPHLLNLSREIVERLVQKLPQEDESPLHERAVGIESTSDSEWDTNLALAQLEKTFLDSDLSHREMGTLVSDRQRLQYIIRVIDETIDEVGYYI